MSTKNRFIVPASITIFIVSLLSLYYWDMLGVGTIRQHDEYHTLDRSNAFLLTNDWFTVYQQNTPTFKKPPLQYWLTAVALKNYSRFRVRIKTSVLSFWDRIVDFHRYTGLPY